MLKETDTEEIIRFFCHIFMIGGISIGGWGNRAPGYAYEPKCCAQYIACLHVHFWEPVLSSNA